MNQNLNDWLLRPLSEVSDNGFSARVMARIAEQNMRSARLEAGAWIAFTLAAAAILILSSAGRKLAAVALSLDISAQVGVSLTVLLLLFAFRGAAE